MKAKKTKPRGRPVVPAAERKRRNFTFRSTDEFHERVSKAAAESGRSMSEEIEWRVGQSFFTRDVVRWAVDAALEKTFAYVDQQRAKEDAERQAERSHSRPFTDLLPKSEDQK
jgi:alkanesulfonate monooxygenase SsuD/methylene tetrahydromethanopterin reductase-like flavin-dependent oxidoreductase (luciferase family)